MSPLDARTFGKRSARGGKRSAAGRPKLGRTEKVCVYLRPELVRAYEEEAERRWPGSTYKRGEVMGEALLSWMLAERLKDGREYEEQSCKRAARRARSTRPAPAAADAKQAGSE